LPVHDPYEGMRHFTWRALPLHVFPFLYGPLNLDPLGTANAGAGWMPASVTFLATLGVFEIARRRSRALTALFAVALLAAAKVWGVPVVNDLGRLPLLDRVWFQYVNGFVAVGVCILAAAGFAFVRRPWSRGHRRALVVWGCVVAAMLAIGLSTMHGARELLAREPWRADHHAMALSAGLFWAIAFPAALMFVSARRRDGTPDGPLLLVASGGVLLQAAATFPTGSLRAFHILNAAAPTAFAIVTLLAIWRGRRMRPTAAVSIATLVTGLTVAVGAWMQPRLPGRYNPLTPAPYVTALAAEPNAPRVYPFDAVLCPDFAAPFGVSSVTNLDNLITRGGGEFFSRFLDPGVPQPARFFGSPAGRSPASPEPLIEFWRHRRYWDLVGVRFVLTQERDPNAIVYREGAHGDAPLTFLYRDPNTGAKLWRNDRAFDRAFLAPDVRMVETADAAMSKLEATADLRRTVFAEGNAECRGDPSFAATTPAGRLLSLRVSPNQVDLRYDAATAGMLTLSDAHARGWSASLNGTSTPLYRVNGAFRGVCLDRAGVHDVVFSYRPPRWSASLFACAAGAIGLAALVATQTRARRYSRGASARPRPDPGPASPAAIG
jgi:hypothetical protein